MHLLLYSFLHSDYTVKKKLNVKIIIIHFQAWPQLCKHLELEVFPTSSEEQGLAKFLLESIWGRKKSLIFDFIAADRTGNVSCPPLILKVLPNEWMSECALTLRLEIDS